MADPDRDPKEDLQHVSGSALVAFGLTVNTLRFLQRKGMLTPEEVHLVVGQTLASFEQSDLVSEPEIHAARQLLSSIASQLGVPMRKPS